MGIIAIDEVKYETDKLSDDGKLVIAHLIEADGRQRAASMDATVFKAATLQLIAELKANHLTDEALVAEEVEITEE